MSGLMPAVEELREIVRRQDLSALDAIEAWSRSDSGRCASCFHFTDPEPNRECGKCNCSGSFMRPPEPAPDFGCVHWSRR